MNSTGPSEIGLIVAAVTAAAALLALFFRERAHRRQDLDAKIDRAVNAGFGRTLIEFREREAEVRDTFDRAVREAGDIDRQLSQMLERSSQDSKKLEKLLQRVTDLVPQVERSMVTVPVALIAEARAAQDPIEAAASLNALLDSEATSRDLRMAGVIAQQQLGNVALAIRLFRRAIELNPHSADARASLIRLETEIGETSPDEGLKEISAIAKQNPSNRNVLSEALNLYSSLDRESDAIQFIDEMIETGCSSVLLWRNKGLALHEIGADDAEIDTAFRTALEKARGDAHEYPNAARAYIAFLLERDRSGDARTVLNTALNLDPTSGEILNLLGDVALAEGDLDQAEAYHRAALDFATSPALRTIIQTDLRRIDARRSLQEAGILPLDGTKGAIPVKPKTSGVAAPTEEGFEGVDPAGVDPSSR